MTSSTRNVSGLLTRTATRYPARTAIVFGGDRISYAELDAASNRVANLLTERGVRPGDKVALSCPNVPQFTAIYFGILKAGAVVVPLNVLLKTREIAYHLDDSEATAYFAFEGSSELPIGREAWSGFQSVSQDADRASQFFLIGSGASVNGVTSDQLYAAAEEVLMEHPAVSLVAIIGVPHPSHGEEIKALVVKKAGDGTTEAELTAWGKEQFAGHKYPRIVEFVDSLPMTSTGKILKRELS